MHNITSIGSELWIYDNDELTNIEGLENIAPESIIDLHIYNNPQLSQCAISNVCEYLLDPAGEVNIYGNASGCNSSEEVEEACEALSCLPQGITFTSQYQIDNFQTNYPNCTEIEGDVWIDGNNITSLNGLNVVTSIGGELKIYDNPLVTLTGLDNLTFLGGALVIGVWGINAQPGQPVECYGNPYLTDISALSGLPHKKNGVYISCNQSLANLAGLEDTDFIDGNLEILGNDALNDLSTFSNLDTITGSLHVGIAPDYEYFGLTNFRGNDSLSDCTGLHNLNYIGDHLEVAGNINLESLAGLENLNTIGGDLRIYGNTLTNLEGINNVNSIGGNLMIANINSLNNLSGLENLEAGSINNLVIAYNSNLTDCLAETICNYLSNPGGMVDILLNAPGCNSPEEVEEACLYISIPEINAGIDFSISPNPIGSVAKIEYTLKQSSAVQLTIYDYVGNKVEVIEQKQSHGKQQIIWNSEGLPAGIYFCILKTNKGIQTVKIIKL